MLVLLFVYCEDLVLQFRDDDFHAPATLHEISFHQKASPNVILEATDHQAGVVVILPNPLRILAVPNLLPSLSLMISRRKVRCLNLLCQCVASVQGIDLIMAIGF